MLVDYNEINEDTINSFRRRNRIKKLEVGVQTDEDIEKTLQILEKDINKLRVENMKLEKALK